MRLKVMSNNQVTKTAQRFIAEVKENKIPFVKAYLYGSYAKGTAGKWSDIDICIVSDAFAGKKWDENERKLWRIRRGIDPRIEPVGISTKEFSSGSPLVSEINSTGTLIKI